MKHEISFIFEGPIKRNYQFLEKSIFRYSPGLNVCVLGGWLSEDWNLTFQVGVLLSVWPEVFLQLLSLRHSCYVNTLKIVTRGIVGLVWEPPLKGACPIDGYSVHYIGVMSQGMKSEWHSVTVDINATRYMLHLTCDKEYDVAITSQIRWGK